MSKNFKPLYVQLAETLVKELKAGTSPFQKPIKENGLPAFVKPINPITGKGYSAMNAINLALKGYDDPRWMSADSASYAGYLVKEGSKGTLINFPKKSEIQAMRTPDGEKIKGADGKTLTRTVEFDRVINEKAFLFNGTQIKDIPSLQEFLEIAAEGKKLSPLEQAEKLISDTKATIVHGGQEAYYDKIKDEIHLPEKSTFENDTKYYQVAVHQLAHWTGHETRLNRPMEGRFGSLEYAKEEFRAATAAMLIGGELKTGHQFGSHAAYAGSWARMLKDDPFEISRVSSDAQKIANFLLSIGQKQDVKQTTTSNDTLTKGDVIAYNDTFYTVLDKRGKSFEMEKGDTGERFKMKPTDNLFAGLVAARNNPPVQQMKPEEVPTQKIGR
ncbi:zincin-like metallopeptidase domain-containing protein [Mucilaginibacter gynuensis]|uniref:Zincin-like metallopeptidase domain-containing protein n=1 Tax=Mucilaginibacter gynuensis TaxID=1302236 RepID=A0ABP8GYP6_9SPHI